MPEPSLFSRKPVDYPLSRRERFALEIHAALLTHPDYRDSNVYDVAHDAVMHADALMQTLDGEDTADDLAH